MTPEQFATAAHGDQLRKYTNQQFESLANHK